jgi:hypothetical protein
MVEAYGVRTALNVCVAVLVIGATVCLRLAPATRHLPLSLLDQPVEMPAR